MKQWVLVVAAAAAACQTVPPADQGASGAPSAAKQERAAAVPKRGAQAPRKIPVRAPDASAAVGVKIPAFTAEAIDLRGDTPATRPFDSHATDQVTVYAIFGTTCPTTQMYVDRMRAIEAEYAAKGVDFVYIYPNKTDPADVKRTYHKAKGFAGALIDDQGAKIAVSTLAGRKTSEVLVVDKAQVIRYRGSIDDNKIEAHAKRRHLAIALDEILADKAVTTPQTSVFA
jgi:hypothetical protein